MDRLYCAGCQSEHPALLFSYSSRKAEPRFCISHQGYYTVCPHLRFSLADIKAWRTGAQDVTIQCENGSCPCPGAVVTYSHYEDEPSFGSISVTWEMAVDENCHHAGWHTPAAFGPNHHES
jgi:hypothetical protein